MKKARLLVVMLLAVVMCFAFTACGGNSEDSGDAIVLKVAVQQNQDHETAKAVARIAEKVEAETEGGLVLDLYTDSALGDYAAVFDEVRMGTIDMAVQSFSGEYDPAFEIGYLPYLFTNYEEAKAVLGEGSNTYTTPVSSMLTNSLLCQLNIRIS